MRSECKGTGIIAGFLARHVPLAWVCALLILACVAAGAVWTSWPGEALADSPPLHANPVGTIWDYPVSDSANIMTSSWAPTGKSSAYRFTICLAETDSVVDLVVTSGAKSQTFSFNGGSSLTAGAAYTFVAGVSKPYTYNIQVQTSTTIGYLLVEEIRDGDL